MFRTFGHLTPDFDGCFTLLAILEPPGASWSPLPELNRRQSVLLFLGGFLGGGTKSDIRLAKAHQGPFKALLLQNAKLSSTFGLQPLILTNVSHFWTPDP